MLNEKQFIDPPSECRGMPFWSLNDTLDSREMVHQVEEFHRAGMGGFFLHSRIGLITEYLGDEWLEALDAAIQRAAELGMLAWLYDEDKWPSGYAGGRVPTANPEYRSKALARLPDSKVLPESSSLITSSNGWNYFIYTTEMGEPWFNGACWVDLMNPDAVRAFLDSTHEKYRERFGQYFGTVIPGIFTDEPIMRLRESWSTLQADYVPYSQFMHERYERNYDESPFDHLAELFEDADEAEEYRYRYWRCAAEQFTKAYTRQVAEWCGKYNLMLTGHFMHEDSIEAQCRWIGAVMPHYRFMQMPGIDHLGLNINNPLTAKQCSSVVNQLGKPAGLSEMYGCSGQNMTFEDREWIAGRHAALGISFICHHLSLYSLRGCRKRDYPPTFSYHQPYWENNSLLEEKQARLTYLLRNSKAVIDILVIHPAESGWRLMRGSGADDRIKKLDTELARLTDMLINSHHDFDFGDESMIADLGKIKRGKFCMGQMKYSTVIVPPVIKLRDSTELLLRRFAETGGQILRLETIENIKSLPEFEFSDIPPEVMVYRRKLDDTTKVVCLFNTSRNTTYELPFTIGLIEFDLNTGKETAVKSIELAPAETRCFVKSYQDITIPDPEFVSLNLQKNWSFVAHNPNAFVLDFAEWCIDDNKWNLPAPVIGVKEQLDKDKYSGKLLLRFSFTNESSLSNAELAVEASHLLKSVFINGKQVKTNGGYYIDKMLLNYNAPLVTGNNIIELEYNFTPSEPISLEAAEKRYGTEIEAVYLVGNFGVTGNMEYPKELPEQIFDDRWNTALPSRRVTILKNPRLIDMQNFCDENLVSSGLPFYAGTVSLSQEIVVTKPLPSVIYFEHIDAITCHVKINGIDLGTLFRRPWRLDIKGFLKDGNNKIELTLKNSLRNLLGPHHHVMGELANVGPYSFSCRDFSASLGESKPTAWYEKKKTETTSWLERCLLSSKFWNITNLT